MASDPHRHHRPGIVRATALPRGGGPGLARRSWRGLAGALLEALDAGPRSAAQWSFEDAERGDWHYVPRARAGVRSRRWAPRRRLRSTTCCAMRWARPGTTRPPASWALEEPLGLIENHRRHYRHPENYA